MHLSNTRPIEWMPTIEPPTCLDCRRAPAAKCQQQADRFRNRKVANTFENSSPWRKCSHHIRRCNPLCQAIWWGVRCTRPSTLVHHLVAPEVDPAKRTDPSNLVALCEHCHITTTGDAGQREYAPTISNVAGATYTYEHGKAATADEAPAPGSVAEAMRWMQGR